MFFFQYFVGILLNSLDLKVYQKPLKRALSESNPIISQEEINSIFSIVDGMDIF